jgi:hypothetical protein
VLDIKSLVRELRSDTKCNMQENNRSELHILDNERKEDFLEMLKGFVTTQVLASTLHCLIAFSGMVLQLGRKTDIMLNFVLITIKSLYAHRETAYISRKVVGPFLRPLRVEKKFI